MLKSADGYVSGQEIADSLGVSRTAVWKTVTALKNEGYNIISTKNRGYKLNTEGDVLNARELLGLGGHAFYERLTSTNDMAKRFALDGCKEFFFVAANSQTAGKGRLGREWESPHNKNIYISVVLYPDIGFESVAQITLISGLAVVKTIRDMTKADAKIKWPNDVLINGKKVVGILTEMQAEVNRILFAVVGIGINVNQTVFDDELKEKATSILLESGIKYKRSEMIAKLMQMLKEYYKIFCEKGFGVFLDEYKKICINLDREVTAVSKGQRINGIAVDISENGELVIDTGDGLVNISSGEATLRTDS